MKLSELEFSNLDNLIYFLVPIIVLVIFIFAYQKRDRIIKALRLNIEYKFKIIKPSLIVIGIILITVSLLGPQILKGHREVEKEGLDIYILIDVSKSMLAQDVKPNRLARTKKSIESLLNSLQGDRVGFIPFSSDAYIQMPLTDDYHLAELFLEVIDTDMIAGGGTNIASAINLAQKSFDKSSQGDRVILIFSDGEEGNRKGVATAKESKEVKIYTVAMGTKKGALIPEYDSNGNRSGYKRDQSGNYVNSKLNPVGLEKIAQAGDGRFYLSTIEGNEIDKLVDDISRLKRDKSRKDKVKKFSKIYQYFLGSGLLIFLIGYFLDERSGLA